MPGSCRPNKSRWPPSSCCGFLSASPRWTEVGVGGNLEWFSGFFPQVQMVFRTSMLICLIYFDICWYIHVCIYIHVHLIWYTIFMCTRCRQPIEVSHCKKKEGDFLKRPVVLFGFCGFCGLFGCCGVCCFVLPLLCWCGRIYIAYYLILLPRSSSVLFGWRHSWRRQQNQKEEH